jgi:hypothetical protein
MTGANLELLTDQARGVLVAKGWPQPTAEVFARSFCEICAVPERTDDSSRRFGALVGHFAVRKDELKLFDTMADALKATAAAGFLVGIGSSSSAKVGIAMTLIQFLRRLIQRGVWLNEDEIRLMTIVIANARHPRDAGVTTEEIVEIMKRTSEEVDSEAVRLCMDRLAAMPTVDGASAKLISSDSRGRWRAHV